MPAASVISPAKMVSFSCIAAHSARLPIITTSRMRTASYSKWSCLSTPTLSREGMVTEPLSDSSSPAMTLSSVDLPAPLAPTSTYRLPGSKVIETPSNKTLGPKRLVRSSRMIIAGRRMHGSGAPRNACVEGYQAPATGRSPFCPKTVTQVSPGHPS